MKLVVECKLFTNVSHLRCVSTNFSLFRFSDLTAFQNIENQVISLFAAQSEEVKFAAAFALGNICVGNINKYLPLIVSQIKEEPKRRYLLLHALKEVQKKRRIIFFFVK